MTPTALKICNAAAFALDMAFNANGGKNIGTLSAAYDHVSMPAGAAFSIWGIIFTWELVFIIAQFLSSAFDDILPRLTPWFCATQIMQGAWVVIFTKTDPQFVGLGGDAWFWISTVVILALPVAFLPVVDALSGLQGSAYWLSFGITINAAWVLLAASLSINMSARAIGLEGGLLSAVAVAVLVGTVFTEFYITGFFGNSRWNAPLAYFPVATWGLGWIYFNLSTSEPEKSDHLRRLMPLYGTDFIMLFKWSALSLAILFVALEVKLVVSKSTSRSFS